MKTKLERILIIALVAVIILAPLTTFLVLYILGSGKTLCLTPECMKTAVHILDSIDYTVNPCDDFYMFSCGNYLKTNFIPEDKTQINAFSKIEDLVAHQLRVILEQPIQQNEIKPFKFIKSHYKTCLDKKRDSSQTLKYLFRQIGGWPVLEGDNWNGGNFDWRNMAHKFRKIGLHSDTFIRLNAEIMLNNSIQRILEIDEPYLHYHEYLKNGWNDKITKEIYKLMVDVAVLLGADSVQAETELQSAMKLILDLAQISVPDEQKRASKNLINIMTVGDLELIFPIVSWSSYINSQLLGVTTVNETTAVNVLYPHHLKNLNGLIIHSDKRTIANYMFWAAIYNEILYINEPIRNRFYEFLAIVEGNTQESPKWMECVNEVTNRLPLVAGALYVRNFFKQEAKQNMKNLVEEILHKFKGELNKIEWMEEDSKVKAKSKIDTMNMYIGYSDELLDDKKLIEYYAELGEVSQDYLLLDLKLTNFTIRSHYKLLLEPVNKTDWRAQPSPIDVNAFYESSTNSILFPAGILQENFFGYGRPRFVNYGGIGYLIGHEIIHGFDDEGRLFDENGNMRDWWGEKTRNSFIEHALCIVEQYNNLTVPEIGFTINGDNSQGENIADNGGIKQAYLAYKSWLSAHGEDMSLPGLANYTNQQMFWLASATSWCSKIRPQKLRDNLLSDEHAPMNFRVNVPFANSEYFAEDFKCPLGSNMNPLTKCKVW